MTLTSARLETPSRPPAKFPSSSPPPRPRALILADDPLAARSLGAHLARGGFASETAAAGGLVLAEIGRTRPHVIFLCLRQHDGPALTLCEEVRQTVSMPIIACSSSDELSLVVEALQAGADDYFVLPMRPAEFVTRVRAVLRRVRRSSSTAPTQDRIVAGDLDVRLQEHRAYRNGELIDLSPTEFRLLTALVRQTGRTVSHSRLLSQVWGAQYTDGGAALRIYVRRLRSKLGNDALIASSRGLGYRFQPAVAVASPAA